MTAVTTDRVWKAGALLVAALLYAVASRAGIEDLRMVAGVALGWAYLRRPGDAAPVPPHNRQRITLLPKE